MSNAFLTGTTTILRPVMIEDVPLLTKWINNEETRRYLNRRFPLTEIEEKTWIEKTSSPSGTPRDIVLIIETIDANIPIGTMGLHGISWVHRNATTGSMIGEKEYRGKGYASDAKMALLKYAFESLGMHKIISHAFSKNTKSIEYSKRCGYVVEATLKEELFHEGVWEDMIVLACFYEDWKKASQHLQLSQPTI